MRRLFHPSAALMVILICVSSAGLAWCVFGDAFNTPLAYIIYFVSSYTLAVVIVALVPIIRRLWVKLAATPLVAALMGSEALRGGAAGTWSVLFDLGYAALVMATGFHYNSNWAVAVALYHVVVAALGFSMATGFARTYKLPKKERSQREISMIMRAGILLALMAVLLFGVMYQMVAHRQAWQFDHIVVIAYALFTFINLTVAIRGVVLVRHVERPSFVASRAIGLSKTLVQLFFLETTMIASFGKGSESFRFTMEAITGGAVFTLVLLIAISLVVFAMRAKQKMVDGE